MGTMDGVPVLEGHLKSKERGKGSVLLFGMITSIPSNVLPQVWLLAFLFFAFFALGTKL